ncbi:Glyoxalase/Bleomycin resistance protein/Dihydroxybiphenyl dioxygenase [Glarea lozoyensis ATCC 20868]|uniref:Glyoxalase/Bleomycin resistance protein/Dihydroxybiphenyl dioxygenase n=1 Tax=Glarea lozoyensis (strain ATCC 20868 / MF5171) TaxID=1116229 RepID=S3CHP8_GLAL2|nr:Glyoxalase/Bleomycin resistance protein/Dihydroxybiphenyl dioxygenase [Glarea lozoyensis ATCC 20868]EPE25375.1 Glyoxalase/Bleomycin resistance protein/Dihydroxybiphenyl dioxygenase [Glarea lozoyensis ATCC 20868]
MGLDHFAIPVPAPKFEETIKFLTTSLAFSNFKEITRPIPTVVGLGETAPYIWLSAVEGDEAEFKNVMKGMHIAFNATNGEQVRQFHEAALKAGGTCNGKPGIRFYHEKYYAAFVLDPVLGINFEVVCHQGDI